MGEETRDLAAVGPNGPHYHLCQAAESHLWTHDEDNCQGNEQETFVTCDLHKEAATLRQSLAAAEARVKELEEERNELRRQHDTALEHLNRDAGVHYPDVISAAYLAADTRKSLREERNELQRRADKAEAALATAREAGIREAIAIAEKNIESAWHPWQLSSASIIRNELADLLLPPFAPDEAATGDEVTVKGEGR